MRKEALLVIDMLNDFVREGAPLEVPDTRKVLPNIRREIDKAREAGNPVVYIVDTHEPDDKEFRKMGWPPHAVKGTEGQQVVDELRPEPGDPVVNKSTYSGFYRSSLESILRERGITDLRLTGCVTHICVMFTAADAALRDYNVSVVQDAVAGLAPEDHEAALRIMKNVMGVELV
ncbi:MAG: cysteine hydrolase [Nitrospirota bacterium]|jgi:nicotinamidase/pyrazinamidase